MSKFLTIFIFFFLNSNFSYADNNFSQASLELNYFFLKNRDIKETRDSIIKNNIKFSFVRYNEKNSFIEITVKELQEKKQFFSLDNKLNLVSKTKFDLMDNLSPEKVSTIFTFEDNLKKRNFYYRIFDNSKFESERCFVFVSGIKKNTENLFVKIINGVGCSTEIKLTHKNIKKILGSIKILEKN